MFEAFSVLSRDAEMDQASHHACHSAFADLDLDLTRLHPVNQGGLCLGEELEGSGEETGCERRRIGEEKVEKMKR